MTTNRTYIAHRNELLERAHQGPRVANLAAAHRTAQRRADDEHQTFVVYDDAYQVYVRRATEPQPAGSTLVETVDPSF